jgi:hypothetical protein
LNSLANHGILPHDGKGYTLPIVAAALASGLAIGPDFANTVGTLGLMTNPENANTTLTNSSTFDLDMLDLHDSMEHDGSLSRADFNIAGDDHTFNEGIWDEVLGVYDGNDVNATLAATARTLRVDNSQANTPNFTLPENLEQVTFVESCLYLLTMGSSPTKMIAPLKFVEVFFQEERLPYAEGWKPSTDIIDFDSGLTACAGALSDISPGNGPVPPVTKRSQITSASLRAALSRRSSSVRRDRRKERAFRSHG